VAARILVINPNSTQAVTDGIRAGLSELNGGAVQIDCVTLAGGPPGIETDEHVEQVIPLLFDLIGREAKETDAFVNACFSDPGLDQLRAATECPVYGIGESAYREAARGGRRFGVISILDASVDRHRRYIDRLGLSHQLAGDLPLGLGVLELADEARTRVRLIEVGTSLREEYGAGVLILGCAGMAMYRDDLEATLGIQVIDPCQAATRNALEGLQA